MNRQTKKRLFKNLNLSEKELDNLAEYFRRENEIKNKEIIIQFLALTIEALRLEFGFGPKRIDQYTMRVNNLMESIELDYVSFEDLLAEISLSPMKIARMSEEVREEKIKEIEQLRGA